MHLSTARLLRAAAQRPLQFVSDCSLETGGEMRRPDACLTTRTTSSAAAAHDSPWSWRPVVLSWQGSRATGREAREAGRLHSLFAA